MFKILILTYSDISFDNVNFDLQKHSGFKKILQFLNICLAFKEHFHGLRVSNILSDKKQKVRK